MSANVNVVRAFYEALDAGDIPAVMQLLDRQVEWRTPASLPYGGTYRGHDGFREFIEKLLQQPGVFRREVGKFIDAGEHVVVPLRFWVTPTGGRTEFEVPEVHIWTLRDGKIAALDAYPDTATVLRALQAESRAN